VLDKGLDQSARMIPMAVRENDGIKACEVVAKMGGVSLERGAIRSSVKEQAARLAAPRDIDRQGETPVRATQAVARQPEPWLPPHKV
jgi:hypothetical protein